MLRPPQPRRQPTGAVSRGFVEDSRTWQGVGRHRTEAVRPRRRASGDDQEPGNSTRSRRSRARRTSSIPPTGPVEGRIGGPGPANPGRNRRYRRQAPPGGSRQDRPQASRLGRTSRSNWTWCRWIRRAPRRSRATCTGKDVLDMTAGKMPLPSALFSKEQRAFLQGARSGGHEDEIPGRSLGPPSCSRPSTSRRLRLGRHRRDVALPDGSRILEISTKCLPEEALNVATEFKAFLAKSGVNDQRKPGDEDQGRAGFLQQESRGGPEGRLNGRGAGQWSYSELLGLLRRWVPDIRVDKARHDLFMRPEVV